WVSRLMLRVSFSMEGVTLEVEMVTPYPWLICSAQIDGPLQLALSRGGAGVAKAVRRSLSSRRGDGCRRRWCGRGFRVRGGGSGRGRLCGARRDAWRLKAGGD